MVASIKSCYSSSLGIPLFNDSPLKGDDYDKFLKNSEDFLTLHTCVTNAANSDLLQQYSEFAREMRDNKRAENNQKVSANKNLGAGSYPPDMMLTILILKEYRNVDFDEIAKANPVLDVDENFYGDEGFESDELDQEGFGMEGDEGGGTVSLDSIDDLY